MVNENRTTSLVLGRLVSNTVFELDCTMCLKRGIDTIPAWEVTAFTMYLAREGDVPLCIACTNDYELDAVHPFVAGYSRAFNACQDVHNSKSFAETFVQETLDYELQGEK